MSLATRKTEALTRLDTLRQQQGVALLDGKKFDRAPLSAIEAELSALTEAEGEAVRRERQAQAEAQEAHRAALRVKLAKTEEQRLEAIERAEKAARELSDALKEALARGSEAFALVRALGFRPPHPIQAIEHEHRLSWRLAATLKPITGLRGRFGQIRFPGSQPRFDTPWRDAEAAEAATDITHAMEGSPK